LRRAPRGTERTHKGPMDTSFEHRLLTESERIGEPRDGAGDLRHLPLPCPSRRGTDAP